LEAEGAFVDDREQYLLSTLCQLYLFYLSSKGGNVDELMLFFGEPAAVQMRKPTEADREKIAEKKAVQDKQFIQSLLAMGKAKGITIKTVSKEEFYKDLHDVL